MRIAILLLGIVPVACLSTKSEVVTCTTNTECLAVGPGLRCDVPSGVCVCAGTYHPGCHNDFLDGGPTADGPSDVPVPPPDVIAQPDGPARPDSPADVPIVDAAIDLSLPDRAVDTRVPDAAGTCEVASDCVDPAKGFCVAGICTGCSANLCASRVDGGASVCATTGIVAGQCVECVTDGQCMNDPAKGFCVNNACTACSATLCAGKVDGGVSSICATTGTAAGQCVECVADGQCTKDPAKGFCVANACTGCTAAICAGRTDGKTTCATTGTATGQCVECAADAQCTKDAAKGFCVANACTGCTAAICGARTDGKTTCAATGTFAGQCVVCTSNAQCSGTKPICATTTDTCRACGSDGECSAIGPGVCMTDGHCATDAEAVYVGTLGSVTCSDSTGTGTVSAPVCSAQAGVTLAKTGPKSVVLIRGMLAAPSLGVTTTIAVSAPVTIVGKNSGLIAPASGADAITITAGEVTLRNLTIQGGTATGIGINAAPAPGSTVTLHMDTCTVKDNPGGGILLNGAAFDIRNTTITGNGVGTTGSTTWGGVFVQSLPATGPANLNLVSVKNNVAPGLTCSASAAIQGDGVFVSGNTLTQVTPSCNITACTPTSATCGMQSTPQ